MEDKIDTTKQYINKNNKKVYKILLVGEDTVYIKSITSKEEIVVYKTTFIVHFSEYTPTKRYWLWDVKVNTGVILKSSFYMDDDGVRTNGAKNPLDNAILIRKFENEYIDV